MHHGILSVAIKMGAILTQNSRKIGLSMEWFVPRFGLESPNLHQTCMLGYSRLVLKMAVLSQSAWKFGLSVNSSKCRVISVPAGSHRWVEGGWDRRNAGVWRREIGTSVGQELTHWGRDKWLQAPFSNKFSCVKIVVSLLQFIPRGPISDKPAFF